MSKFHRNVYILGFTSLLNDAASEMVVPLLPAFLTGVLGAGPAMLGSMDGLANAIASLLKLWTGRQVDKTGQLRPWILGGYSLSSLVRPVLGLSTGPVQVVLIRALDRVGKGFRSAPRDALLEASVQPAQRASAFGLHRSMDHAGAVVGSFLAWVALAIFHWDLRTLFLACIVPGLLTMALLFFGLKGVDRPAPKTPPPDVPLPPMLKRFLLGVALLGLGAGTESFLLLLVGGSTMALSGLPLLWMGLHIVKSLSALWAGPVADRLGRRGVFVAGKLVHVALFLAFAIAHSPLILSLLFLAHGLYEGLSEGAEKAIIADLAPEGGKGTAFGAWNLVTGLVALPAGLLFGGIWEMVGAPTAFICAALLTVVGVGVTASVRPQMA